MNVGYFGLGKLGLACALAVESKGHRVVGWDPSLPVQEIILSKQLPYHEEGAQELLELSRIEILLPDAVVAGSDILFVAVQTPHAESYEGITRVPQERMDFDYSFLRDVCKQISHEVDLLKQDKIVVIVSTVLPGTIEREIKPLLSSRIKLCYSPQFLAMGTAIPDFLNPEFILFGVDDADAAVVARRFYESIVTAPYYPTSITNAELIKVVYNTFISTKVAFINTIMELCHKLGADVDVVSDALALATDRIISPKYLRGGMGDGGGCHPRDNIALSWLARKTGLSYDWFGHIMEAREKQTDWLASLVVSAHADWPELPVYIWGSAFKAETNLETGSCALLLDQLLREYGIECTLADPYVPARPHDLPPEPALIFIGANHKEVIDYQFVAGSVVIDPWGCIQNQPGIAVIRIGRNGGKGR